MYDWNELNEKFKPLEKMIFIDTKLVKVKQCEVSEIELELLNTNLLSFFNLDAFSSLYLQIFH